MHPLFHYAEIRIKSSGRLIHIRKRLFHDKERTFYRFCCLYFSGDAVLPGYHRHFQRIPAARRYLGKYHLIPPGLPLHNSTRAARNRMPHRA